MPRRKDDAPIPIPMDLETAKKIMTNKAIGHDDPLVRRAAEVLVAAGEGIRTVGQIAVDVEKKMGGGILFITDERVTRIGKRVIFNFGRKKGQTNGNDRNSPK